MGLGAGLFCRLGMLVSSISKKPKSGSSCTCKTAFAGIPCYISPVPLPINKISSSVYNSKHYGELFARSILPWRPVTSDTSSDQLHVFSMFCKLETGLYMERRINESTVRKDAGLAVLLGKSSFI